MFEKLYSLDTFLNFGHTKIIMVLAIIEGRIYSFHHNVVINNDTTFEQYYGKVEQHIKTKFEDGYDLDVISDFIIKIWIYMGAR